MDFSVWMPVLLEEYEQIKVSIDLEGNLTEAEKRELLKFAKKSPIYNTHIKPGSDQYCITPQTKVGYPQPNDEARSIDRSHPALLCISVGMNAATNGSP